MGKPYIDDICWSGAYIDLFISEIARTKIQKIKCFYAWSKKWLFFNVYADAFVVYTEYETPGLVVNVRG